MTQATKKRIHKVAVFLDDVIAMALWVGAFYAVYLTAYALS